MEFAAAESGRVLNGRFQERYRKKRQTATETEMPARYDIDAIDLYAGCLQRRGKISR